MRNSAWQYVLGENYCTKVTDGTHDTPKQVASGKYLVTSKHIKGDEIDFDDAYFISDEDFHEINKRSKVDQWDIIISMIGAYCGFCFIERNSNINYAVKNVGLFKAGTELNAKWLYYYLNSSIGKANLDAAKGGSSQPYIALGALRKLPILTPVDDLFKEKIVGVLNCIDEKIRTNNRINAELEAMVKTLYDYWFVQFDFPDANGKPYKSSGGKMVYNPTLKREIPIGWEVKTIGEYAEVKKGDLITAKDTKDGDVKVVAAGVDFSYTHSDSNRDKNTITISGSGANAGFINFWREPIFASDCITVRGATDTETLLLLHHLRFIQSHILSQATGSAQPHVYPSDIKILNYIIPSVFLIDSFGKLAISMNNQIANNIKENQHLTQLRDWLLPMLMNGQVTVA